jgi:CRISPR-associated protein Cas1
VGLVAITTPGCTVRVRAGGIAVERRGVVLQSLRPHTIRELQLHGSTELTAAARKLLLKEGVDVVFLDGWGGLVGRLVPPESPRGERRLAWYRLVCDPQRRLCVARSIVDGKIRNQRAVLQRRQRSLKRLPIADALAAMRALLPRAAGAGSLDVLRGFEGAAARWYFGAFGEAVSNEAFTFSGRSRRPPRDPINACLSYGYALLVARCQRAVERAGLDVYAGCFHEAGRGAPALALDLAEEARPVVDGLVLSLMNRRQLGPEDFRVPTAEELGAEAEVGEGAVYLGPVARDILLRAFDHRLRDLERHPLREDRWALGELLVEQARQLARVAEGEQEQYRPLLLRG